MANDTLPIRNGSNGVSTNHSSTTLTSNGNSTSNANGASNGNGTSTVPSYTVKTGLAQMLKGGVIMDVINAEQVTILSWPQIS